MQKNINYWLLKSEPNEFSIDDLAQRGQKGEPWDGIRNYQARNFLRAMKIGDLALIYHSSCDVPAAVGIATVIKAAYPDPYAIDKESKYFDEKSTADNIRWSLVDVRFQSKFTQPVSLKTIKSTASLADMKLINSARLSVSPVKETEFNAILKLSESPKD